MHQLATLGLVGNEPVQRLLACHAALRRRRYAPPQGTTLHSCPGHYVGAMTPSALTPLHDRRLFQECQPFLTGVARAPVKALQAEGLHMPTAAAAGMNVRAAAGAPVE